MKTTRAKSEVIEDIMATLRRVPTSRLGVVRDLVHALATPQETNGQGKARVCKKVSLVDTPFCGMWKDREDITDEQTFARQLREMVEARGDRGKNVR
ncbi:MAG: hypothetical protein AB7P69_18790 [Candidatus Binatia bacterium]